MRSFYSGVEANSNCASRRVTVFEMGCRDDLHLDSSFRVHACAHRKQTH